MRKRLLWQLYPSYLAITILALIAITGFTIGSIRSFYLDHLRDDLEARALLIRHQAEPLLSREKHDRLNQLCRELGQEAKLQITLIDRSGRVLADSQEDPEIVRYQYDVEVQEALNGGTGYNVRFSPTLGRYMMHVAVPMGGGQNISGVVRTSLPVATVAETLQGIYGQILLAGTVVALLAALVGWYVSRRLTRQIETLKEGAVRFASGDLTSRLPVPDSSEMGFLAKAMNRMASQLNERLVTIMEQRRELETILTSMVEGVLVVDRENRIQNLNEAGASLIGVDAARAKGRNVQEVCRNTDLQDIVQRAISTYEPVEGQVILRNEWEKYLQAHGTQLRDAGGKVIGALVVLNDVTRYKRLETIRREFVANVSHELKTPVTSIKGFVETLLDEPIEDTDEVRRFLKIISRHADRLSAIIEDLLALSRIEQADERQMIQRSTCSIQEVLEAAAQDCQLKANEKQMELNIECDMRLTAAINAPLIEQAVANLIDNAIKYSEPGQRVDVLAYQEDQQVLIEVRDRGCGISSEQQERIFERFYRVDKGRSRKLGGTGLGLAIVKHIAHANGGSITVKSTPGEGSVFTLNIPVSQ